MLTARAASSATVSYIAQTLDQLRNLTPLTLEAPPAIAPVFIPNCSVGNATFDCPLANFVELEMRTIDPHSADLVNQYTKPAL
jgi:hypothetical protein